MTKREINERLRDTSKDVYQLLIIIDKYTHNGYDDLVSVRESVADALKHLYKAEDNFLYTEVELGIEPYRKRGERK